MDNILDLLMDDFSIGTKITEEDKKILCDPEHLELQIEEYKQIQIHHYTFQSSQTSGFFGYEEPGEHEIVNTGRIDLYHNIDELNSCLAERLAYFLSPYKGGVVGVVGLGNHNYVADSLGPEVIQRLPIRTIDELEITSCFKKIVALHPYTATPSGDDLTAIISSFAHAIGATCLLLIDSSHSSSFGKLCSRLCLNNMGIHGKLSSFSLTAKELGVPVVCITVPTTIHINDLTRPVIDTNEENSLLSLLNIREVIRTAAYIIAYSILKVSYPALAPASCCQLVEYPILY